MGVKFETNLNTELLKIVAVGAMTLDHISVLAPEYEVPLRWVGRIAFPIFCYCMTVGLVHTRDVRKYVLRLGLFALISQPFYTLVFYAGSLEQDWWQLNILFTLLLSLVAMWGLKEKHYLLSLVMVALLCFPGIDYGVLGVVPMAIFYYCRERRGLGMMLYILLYIALALINGTMESPLDLKIGDVALGFEIFALLAVPFIFIKRPRGKLRLSKWWFYAYYPLHLYAIILVRLLIEA